MGAPDVIAKKAKVVDEVKATMEDAALMFCVRSEGITVNELNALRQKLPESVTMRCIKNTLVKRAAEDYPRFQGGDSLLEYSNYWFFAPEDEMRPAVEVWTDYIKESKKVSLIATSAAHVDGIARPSFGCAVPAMHCRVAVHSRVAVGLPTRGCQGYRCYP